MTQSETPIYTVRISQRARRVRLSITPRKGLECVIPPAFNQKKIPEIIHQHRAWIEKNLLKIQNKNIASDALPEIIPLAALNEDWKIEYFNLPTQKITYLEKPNKTIVLLGDISDQIQCKNILLQWVKNKAHPYLENFLNQLSQTTQLNYQKFILRGQKTVWGSCSSKKIIRLNYKLIFLPTHLVQHIILHELAHTVHFNHSTKFWKLLASFDSEWKTHSHAARRLAQSEWVPNWVF